MIEVYDIGNENWNSHGNAVLIPKKANVKMVAGGKYDMTMTHPIDEHGKWEHLVPGAVLRVPVPEEKIENAYSGYAVDIYKVTASEAQIRESPVAPSAISYTEWNDSAEYSVGDFVSTSLYWGHRNWKCTYFDTNSPQAMVPPYASSWWEPVADTTAGAAVLVSVAQGGELYFIEDVDSTWYKLSTYYGIVGYVKKSQVTFDRHLDPSEVKPRIIKDQLMLITEATADTKSGIVSVAAEHVSYDLNGIIIKQIEIAQASPAMAIGRMMEALMKPYRGTIATNLTAEENGTYTDSIKGKSGMYCLLDPDKGIVGTFGAELHRDNWDLFIMQKTEKDRGFRLRYRKNMLGVNWKRKSDELVNCVVPVAKDEKGEPLYLPELWVEPENTDQFPRVRMRELPVSGQVGKDKGDGTGDTWTLNDLYAEMRTKAEEQFTVDKVDQIIEEVTVDFEMMGDTAEYQELKKLENILLYDTVGAINEKIGLDVKLTVTELEWDAIREKVLALKLSSGNAKAGKNVTGYNVKNKSIGANKLSDDVASGILEQVRDIIPEYADPNAARPSTFSVIDSLTSTSATDALSANQGRVLNGHWVSLGTANDPVTDLADIPNNSTGNVVLAAAISPSGQLRSHSFWKSGSSATRYVIHVYDQYAGREYFQVNYDGTLKGWTEVTTGGDLGNFAKKIVLNNTVDTWAKVWAIIDTLEVRETATLYAVSGAYALLSGGATSEMMVGTITRVGQTDQFEIIAKTTNNRLICARITGASSSSAGTYEEINYSSRQMGSNDNPITSLANIPLNSSGNMILAAAVSPTGSLGSYAYWKHGNDDTRWSIMAIYEQNNRAYINSYANSAYSGWRELVTDRISTFRAVSNNSKVTFTIPSASHAMVMIGSSNFAMFMSSQNVLSTGTMPSGFTASNSGTSVTITRNNSTAYVCSVIIVPA